VSLICEPFPLSSDAKIVQFEKDDAVVRHDRQIGYVYLLEVDGVAELLEMISSKRSSTPRGMLKPLVYLILTTCQLPRADEQ